MRRFFQSFVRIITGVGVFFATVGLPSFAPVPNGEAAFPCAGHGCGCLTAEACRTHCCCIKPQPVTTCCSSEQAPPSNSSDKAPKPAYGHALRPLECKGLDGFVAGGALLFPPTMAVLLVLDTTAHQHHLNPMEALTDFFDPKPAAPPPRV